MPMYASTPPARNLMNGSVDMFVGLSSLVGSFRLRTMARQCRALSRLSGEMVPTTTRLARPATVAITSGLWRKTDMNAKNQTAPK